MCVCQVVCQCCDENDKDPNSALEKLITRVREGQLGQRTFFRLLTSIQEDLPSPLPQELYSVLEEVQESSQELQERQVPGAEEPPYM